MDETIELRQASEADVVAIRELTRDAYSKWVAVIGREPKPMLADYAVAIQRHRFDLLYVAGVLAGLIETIDEGDRLLIENVAVSPAFQGRGLGSKLLAHAEQIALLLGHKRIWLYTNSRFGGNVRLYSRHGYHVDSEEQIDGGMTKVNMSKDLGRS